MLLVWLTELDPIEETQRGVSIKIKHNVGEVIIRNGEKTARQWKYN